MISLNVDNVSQCDNKVFLNCVLFTCHGSAELLSRLNSCYCMDISIFVSRIADSPERPIRTESSPLAMRPLCCSELQRVAVLCSACKTGSRSNKASIKLFYFILFSILSFSLSFLILPPLPLVALCPPESRSCGKYRHLGMRWLWLAGSIKL